MDITFISDTHGLHDRLKLNGGTVLIHAGDVTEYGTENEVEEFLFWFSRQRFNYKIFIAGNHDLFLEASTPAQRRKIIPENVTYLQNSGIELEGLKIWGSPVTPYFLGMAFNTREGKEIRKVWQKIPANTDLVITHGPLKGILDNGLGDEGLYQRISDIQPAIHCFGHVHGLHSSVINNGTMFINAALVNKPDWILSNEYNIVGKPITANIPRARSIFNFLIF